MPNDANITSPITLFGAARSGTTLISSVFRLHSHTSDQFIGETSNLVFGMWGATEIARGVTLPLWDQERMLSEDERSGVIVRAGVLAAFPGDQQRWFHKPIGIPTALTGRFSDDDWDEGAEWFWNAWRSMFPDSRQIVALRHPCDVMLSQSKWADLNPSNLWGDYAFLMHMCAHPSAVDLHVVYYDDVIAEPEAAVRGMFEAVGLPFEPEVLRAFDQVHVAAPDRRDGSGSSGSRRDAWGELDAVDLDPGYKAAIDAAFARMGRTIDWPDHLRNPSGGRVGEMSDAARADFQAGEVERLKRRIQMLNHGFLGERRLAREEAQRWQNFVNRYRHLLPLSRELESELDRQLGTSGSKPDPSAQGDSGTAKMQEPALALVLPSGVTEGGVTTQVIELAKALAPSESVLLIRHPDKGTPLEIELPSDVPVAVCHSHPFPLESKIERYAAEYARVLPGVLVPNYNYAGYALTAKLSERRPADVRTMGMAHADDVHYFALLAYYEPIIHSFVAATAEIAATLRLLLPQRAADINVLRAAIPVDEGLTLPDRSAGESLRVCYAGSLDYGPARPMSLVQLARLLVRRDVPFTFTIVGEGSARADLQAQLDEFDEEFSGRVVLLSSMAEGEMAELWSNQDVCVSVADGADAPTSMLEAMAQGCVPVVTERSDAEAVVEDGVTGFAMPTGDISALGARLVELSADPGLFSEMAGAAHTAVVERYSTAGYARAIAAIAADVWAEEPRAWPQDRPVLPASRAAFEDDVARRLTELRNGDASV